MNEATKKFIKVKFKEYYKKAKIKIPKDFYWREWGFIFFDNYFPEKTFMRRHKSFNSDKQLIDYLRENSPAHVYFSSAIYQYPAASMENKGWLSADLIFDLDADHILGDKYYPYEKALEVVKKETLKLVDFLTNDFGFEEKKIEIVFSGSRGYHVHVRSKEVRELGSRERREIVNYVTATGFDIEKSSYLEDRVVNYGSEGLKRCRYCNKTTKKIVCPECGRDTIRLVERGNLKISNFEGWGKRLYKGIMNFFDELKEKSKEEGVEKLKKIGIEKKTAMKIMSMAKEERMSKRMERMREGKIGFFPMWVWRRIIEEERVKFADRVDEPVTADIKRLIRMPASLHAKSSLEAKPLSIKDLSNFYPLEDAVVFGNSEVAIKVNKNSSIKMKGKRYDFKEGEKAPVPEHVALYLLCRGIAEIAYF